MINSKKIPKVMNVHTSGTPPIFIGKHKNMLTPTSHVISRGLKSLIIEAMRSYTFRSMMIHAYDFPSSDQLEEDSESYECAHERHATHFHRKTY